ncbi:Threonine dehydrogenase [Minicystis rosea]|nr:Threonine dehydrogenase [Minicystis rosea]
MGTSSRSASLSRCDLAPVRGFNQTSFEMCDLLGGTISNIGCHGSGEYVSIPRVEWGVAMSDETTRTALCPGGKCGSSGCSVFGRAT